MPELGSRSHRTSNNRPSFSLTLRGIAAARADRPVLVDVDATFTERSRVALVGPNGVGKSTLLRIMAGRSQPGSGTIAASPPSLSVGLLDQEVSPEPGVSVRRFVADQLGVAAAEAELATASSRLAEAGESRAADRYEQALERYLSLGAADLDARLEQVADDLGLRRHLLDAEASTLSGGERERLGLMVVILSRFDLTLLDEPTNNLDLDGLERLERWVGGHDGGLVIVSHDRTFLERTVTSVLEIDHHHHTVAEFGGGWEAFMHEREAAAALAAQRYEDYVDERDRLAGRSQQQREWAARGLSRARKKPSDGDKHRRNFEMAQTERLAAKAKASQRAMERLEVVDKPWQPWDLRFTIGRAPRSATVVAAFDRAVLRRGTFSLGPLDLEIRWADRVAVVGRNGSGKSTLVEAMLGSRAPESGAIRLGSGVIVGELDQGRAGLDSDGGTAVASGADVASDRSGDSHHSLLRRFQDRSGLAVDEARSVLAKFGLDAEAVMRPFASLSPGERTRSQLAVFQATGVNLLVLDEPTNHLDLPAIEQLESALGAFDGTLVLVTHDRRLLENVALTRTVTLGDD